MAKILVTGANGQVGYSLVQQLTGQVELLALDRNQLDITDKKSVFTIVGSFKPDVIINAAAYTAVDLAEKEVSLSENINVKGAEYLAQAANKIGAAILHISTDYVFDGKQLSEYKELDQTNPQNIYGKTKLAGELAVQNANARSIILRTSWVFSEHGNNFVKTIIRLAKERDSLGIVADQFGGPTYARDIAKALIQISQKITQGENVEYGIYHFSGKPYVSWYDFAKVILEQVKLQRILKETPCLKMIGTADYPTPAKRPANSRLDPTKIKRNFSIEPSDWKDALTNLTNYIKD